MSALSNIVGRCYVSESNLSVIRFFLTKVNKDQWKKLSKKERKKWLREVVDEHIENRELYDFVNRGCRS